MKLVVKRNMDRDRERAREIVDRYYIPEINQILGARSLLHAFKGSLANVGIDALGDPEEIKAKQLETSAKIKPLEDKRQELQSLIDNAATALEIDAIIETVKRQYPNG